MPGAERDTEAAAKVVRVDVWLRSVFHIDLNRGEQESRLALLHVCRQQARCLRVLAGGVGTPLAWNNAQEGGASLRSERAVSTASCNNQYLLSRSCH